MLYDFCLGGFTAVVSFLFSTSQFMIGQRFLDVIDCTRLPFSAEKAERIAIISYWQSFDVG
jgi:hypothetical protein